MTGAGHDIRAPAADEESPGAFADMDAGVSDDDEKISVLDQVAEAGGPDLR